MVKKGPFLKTASLTTRVSSQFASIIENFCSTSFIEAPFGLQQAMHIIAKKQRSRYSFIEKDFIILKIINMKNTNNRRVYLYYS